MTKQILTAITAIVALLFTSCASMNTFYTDYLGTPDKVQSSVTFLASVAKPYVDAEASAQIHTYAQHLVNLTSYDFSAIHALIPQTKDAQANALIQAAVLYIDYNVKRVGERNQNALAYVRAVGQALLNAGF